MRMIFDPRQSAHAPALEMHNGGWVAHAEVPGRAANIGAALGATEAPADHGLASITAIHDPAYVDFLRSAHRRWLEAGREGDAVGYIWPVARRRDVQLDRIDAMLGRYSMDAGTPITADTWDAAYWAAQSALTALDAVLAGDRVAFALCRPPGHHAGADYLGGYCYLNNAAIAAQAARDAGATRVAILDVDYHHGNGTQDIFWNRGDVLFASIHGDPRIDYPFYWGHADERGEGAGEGATLNLPLPHGTAIAPYLAALDQVLAAIRAFAPDMLIVSFGADTYEADPISHFAIRTQDYAEIAGAIAKLALPSVIVMEGGYAVDALGANVAGFLSGL
ncbi:histone deacetylase family protein [Sphingomonas gilva]|uniref:Histone deacetylase family protein n=1 Tax=Sphingomonas gilva TaxID=2305907 RepID=A0A396RQI9_9SPHN|nr:histone deacetylase family protein [Sphingomonas gilva]RHW18748.1 histone deacetylase family protein [Sphingomonas gilva]